VIEKKAQDYPDRRKECLPYYSVGRNASPRCLLSPLYVGGGGRTSIRGEEEAGDFHH